MSIRTSLPSPHESFNTPQHDRIVPIPGYGASCAGQGSFLVWPCPHAASPLSLNPSVSCFVAAVVLSSFNPGVETSVCSLAQTS